MINGWKIYKVKLKVLKFHDKKVGKTSLKKKKIFHWTDRIKNRVRIFSKEKNLKCNLIYTKKTRNFHRKKEKHLFLVHWIQWSWYSLVILVSHFLSTLHLPTPPPICNVQLSKEKRQKSSKLLRVRKLFNRQTASPLPWIKTFNSSCQCFYFFSIQIVQPNSREGQDSSLVKPFPPSYIFTSLPSNTNPNLNFFLFF